MNNTNNTEGYIKLGLGLHVKTMSFVCITYSLQLDTLAKMNSSLHLLLMMHVYIYFIVNFSDHVKSLHHQRDCTPRPRHQPPLLPHTRRKHPRRHRIRHRAETAHFRQLLHPESVCDRHLCRAPHPHLCSIPAPGLLAVWTYWLHHFHRGRLHRTFGEFLVYFYHQR